MAYPSKVPSSMAHGLHCSQERDFINLDPLPLIPSTPCLQPAMKTPTMSKKLSIFDDERNKILQSLNDIRLSVSVSEMPTTNGMKENLVDLGDESRNRMQSLSGSVDQFKNMNLVEQSFLSEESQGNQEVRNLPLSEKLKYLSLEVGQYMTDCFPAGNKRNYVVDTLAQTFYMYSLHDFHRVTGESAIAGILKFFVGIPLDCPIPVVTLKQEKQIDQLRSALFKECGFSFEVSIIPVMCFRHKRSIFHFSFRDPACLPFRLITLLQVKNKKGKEIILDSNSRVYSSMKDWRKHNTLSPSTIYVSTVDPHNRDEDSSSHYKLTKLQTPSCQASKMAFDMMDIAVGVGAVGGGIACLLTGGLALPVLLAGELAASVYMGFRGSMSLLDKRRHKAKSR